MNTTPCAECGTWGIFESMKIIGNELYCDDCFDEFEFNRYEKELLERDEE